MVAAARAMETHRPDSLAQDPLAEHLVRAAGVCADWPVRIQDVPDGDANPLWGRLGRYFGLRTRVFDDFLIKSAAAGADQIVVLGAGLDSRAFRLDLPAHSTIYELDQGGVLSFKQAVFERLGATPKVTRRTIPVDLRDDWAPALLAAGFDPARPTTWLAEGVLLYLPGAAERYLVGTVDRLSVPGSALVYEVKLGVESPVVQTSPIYRSTVREIGIDLIALFPTGPRPDSCADLAARGWSASMHTAFDFSRRHGRGPLPQPDDALSINRWVFCEKLSPTGT